MSHFDILFDISLSHFYTLAHRTVKCHNVWLTRRSVQHVHTHTHARTAPFILGQNNFHIGIYHKICVTVRVPIVLDAKIMLVDGTVDTHSNSNTNINSKTTTIKIKREEFLSSIMMECVTAQTFKFRHNSINGKQARNKAEEEKWTTLAQAHTLTHTHWYAHQKHQSTLCSSTDV